MKLNHIIMAGAAALLLAASAPEAARAVPAYPRPMTVTQEDGTTLVIRKFGDEWGHYTVDAHDNLLVDVNGVYQYGKLDGTGKVVASGVRATMNPTAAEQAFLRTIDSDKVVKVARENAVAGYQTRRAMLPPVKNVPASRAAAKLPEGLVAPTLTGMLTTNFPSSGKQKAIVILVEFSDAKFTISNPHDYFNRMLNEKGFNDYGCWGSAHDYFLEVSGGKFDCDFDLYGPVTLPNKMSYYGGNDSYGNDKAPEYMAIHACQMLDNTVDFSQYDRDGDGVIDNIFIFYAGQGEATGGGSNTVWPHSWDIRYTGTTWRYDGKILGNYACSNEWVTYPKNYTEPRADGIGTFVHEFSHVMGLPDLYHTADSYGTSFTVGDWSVLDSGPYLNDGLCPPTYTAFERISMGWLEPTVISGPMNGKLESLKSNTAYVIPTEKSNEFFVLENRQQEGLDAYLPGHGMLIWHIDYNKTVWTNNEVNNTSSHNYVDIVEANKQTSEYGSKTRSGNPFPGTNNVTSFTSDTDPALRSWSNKKIDLPLTDIAEASGIVTFKVAGGAVNLDTPVMRPASDVTPRGCTLRWNAVDNAEEYILACTLDDNTPVEGLDGYKLTDTNLTVTSLDPATTYKVSVTASANNGMSLSQPSNEVTFTTGELTFDYIIPEALPAALDNNAFSASWNPVDGATSYLLSVYSKTPSEYATILLDFTGMKYPTEDLPAGWKTNATKQLYTQSSYSVVSPSLRLAIGEYIESPVYTGDITRVSFYNRTSTSATEKNKIRVMFLVNGDWVEATSAKLSPTMSQTTITEGIPEGARALRLLYDGSLSTDVGVDDISIEYVSKIDNVYHGDFNAKNVGNVTAYNVTGLDPTTQYFYTVQAHNGQVTSMPSPEIAVSSSNSGISDTFVTPSLAPTRYYNLQGVEVNAARLTPGIYIKVEGNKTSKVLVK